MKLIDDMEIIQSFTIDHNNLYPGIYISREDQNFTTFDLRITKPNREPAMTPAAMHTLEHLMATWFRNNVDIKGDVVYVGPMGCHGKGTKILMYDGSVKNVEDIVIGDLLIGEYSEPVKESENGFTCTLNADISCFNMKNGEELCAFQITETVSNLNRYKAISECKNLLAEKIAEEIMYGM